MLLIDELNKELINDKISFVLESATYNLKVGTLSLCLVYQDGLFISPELTQKVKKYISFNVPEQIKTVNIKYRKNYYDEAMIQTVILAKFKKQMPIINIYKDDINCNGNNVKLCIEDKFISLLSNSNILEDIKEELLHKFYDNFIIETDFIPTRTDCFSHDFDEEFVEIQAVPNYSINLVAKEAYIGEEIEEKPQLIALITKPVEGVCVAGKIRNFEQRKTKPKLGENGKERPEKEYYTFEVYDYSGAIRCVYFPTKANISKMEKLENDMEISLFGSAEEDNYSHGLTFRPKVINLCIFEDGFFAKTYSKQIPNKYVYVEPEKFSYATQENLFVAKPEIKNEYLKNNTFVVFDLETTGTNPTHDKIIEIGAVKLVNGELCETFSALVNPEIHIPEDATRVNHITDADVKNARTIKEILPDFLKFCENCVMVSYVISFDYNFILNNCREQNFVINNETFDAFVLAKKEIKGIKNYKLTTVASHLGVSLENAHRAVYDAIATAEVMIKLLEKN